MSKKKKILLGIALTIFCLFITYRYIGFKGYLKIYKIPSTSSSPTLEPGDYIFISNLALVKNNDFIVFERIDKNTGLTKYVSRMVAKEKDTLSIINGTTFINNTNIDKTIRTKHSYKMHMSTLKELGLLQNNNDYYQISNDSIIIFLEDKTVKSISENTIKLSNINPNKVHESFSKEWNSYNFGPLIIPKNKFFVLGDNRDNAMDSRFIGLIDKGNYIGKVINVH